MDRIKESRFTVTLDNKMQHISENTCFTILISVYAIYAKMLIKLTYYYLVWLK